MTPPPTITIPLSAGRVLGFHWNAELEGIAGRIAQHTAEPSHSAIETFAAQFFIVGQLIDAAVLRSCPKAMALPDEPAAATLLRTISIADMEKLLATLLCLQRGLRADEALAYYDTRSRPVSPSLARIEHLAVADVLANPDRMSEAA